MPPGSYSFTLQQGESLAKQFTIKDATQNPPTPIDITGWTARAQAKDMTTGEILFNMTTENGGLTNGGATGTFSMNPLAVSTFTIAVKSYEFTFFARNSGGVNKSYLLGTMTVVDGQASYP